MRLSTKLLTFGAVLLGLEVPSIVSSTAHLIKREVAAIEGELASVGTNLNSYDTAMHSFAQGGGTLAQALLLHTDATATVSSLDATITDVEAVPSLTEPDAQAIEQVIESLEPILIDICTTFISAINAGSGIPIGGVNALVRSDLISVVNAFDELTEALESASPVDVAAELADVKAQVDLACVIP